MKRRHMPGCYCCSPCNVIEESELPFIKIAGYKSEFGWQNMDSQGCCWCITFVPEEIDWTVTCSGTLGTQKYNRKIAGTQYAYEYSVPGFGGVGAGPIICGATFPFPDCPDDSCPSLHAVQTTSMDAEMQIDWAIKFAHRVQKISICLSKKTVSCEGEDDEEKWIMQSSKFYLWNVSAIGKRSFSVVTTGASDSPCYDLLDEWYVNLTCNLTEDFCCESPVELECSTRLQPNVFLESGNVVFTRVKFFDELPTGTVQFCDADTPENCDWGDPESWQTSCNAPDEYETQFCVSVSGWPEEIYNCMCELTYDGGLEEVLLRPQLRWPTCKQNGNFRVNDRQCTYVVQGCDAQALIRECRINLDEPDCDAIPVNWPKQEGCYWYKDPQEGDCQGCAPGFTTFYEYFLSENNWFTECDGGILGGVAFLPLIAWPPNMVQANFDCNSEEGCNASCCIYQLCEYEDSTCEFCYAKFIGGFTDLSELTESFECDWVANANYCLTPGCWSIQIADKIQPSSVTLGGPILGEPEVT